MSSKNYGTQFLRGLSALLPSIILLLTMQASAQARSPLLTRHVYQAVISGRAQFLYWMPETQVLRINVVLPIRDQAGLDKFLREVYDPSSPSYRHFLTVPEFTVRFGPTQVDYQALIDYLTSYGFGVVGGSRDAMDVQAEGTVGSVEAAFNVFMGVYQHPTENRTFFSPDREPTVDLPFPLWHISGLDNYSIARPAIVRASASAQPAAWTGSGPDFSFLGSDMRAAYYGSGPLTGSGQNIGLFELYGGYDIEDLNTYYTNVGQTRTATVTGISTDGTSVNCVFPGCDDTEAILDMTQALGMAPGVTTVYVYVGSGNPIDDTAILGAMTSDQPLPAQLSSSWLWKTPDPTTDDPYFQKMAAQGQSFFQASGDWGAWPNPSDPYYYPAEDDWVTTVGGTDLSTESAGGPWSSETAWVDSGGGIAPADPDDFPIPSWQQLSGVINSGNGGSTVYRNAPDVAANADFSFYVCADQTTCTANVLGGTSFAAPMWAGYLALANQHQAADADPPFGFINPFIYPIGVGSGYGSALHDITSGNNDCCGQSVWYNAVSGYDLVTGWGSPNGPGLISALDGTSNPPTAAASPTSLSFVSKYDQPVTDTDTLTNSGPDPLTIHYVDVTGDSSFSLSYNSCPNYLPAGQSCYVQVTFAPQGCLLNPTGQLYYSDNGGNGGQIVSLTGKTLSCTLTPQGK